MKMGCFHPIFSPCNGNGIDTNNDVIDKNLGSPRIKIMMSLVSAAVRAPFVSSTLLPPSCFPTPLDVFEPLKMVVEIKLRESMGVQNSNGTEILALPKLV